MKLVATQNQPFIWARSFPALNPQPGFLLGSLEPVGESQTSGELQSPFGRVLVARDSPGSFCQLG